MALKMEKVAAIPAGPHTGIITQCHETTKVFSPQQGPEPVVEIVIQPKYAKAGFRTLPVSVIFAAKNLTSLSGLAAFLDRVGLNLEDGDQFVPQSLEGTTVAFTAETKQDGFVVVLKDTIRKS